MHGLIIEFAGIVSHDTMLFRLQQLAQLEAKRA
jgi:hypothetical protein